jgi:very-long-chain (3R)-3-hydroxyacyl-CoA dehydratase
VADTPAGTKAYLIAYNLASAAGWSYVLYQTIQHLSGATAPPPALASEQTLAAASSLLTRVLAWLHALLPALVPAPSLAAEIHAQLPAELKTVWQRAGTLHAALGDTVAAVQTAAVLEVAHAALGIVRSPLVTTFMQVLSRLIAVWAIADRIEVVSARPPLRLLFPLLITRADRRARRRSTRPACSRGP